MLALAAMLLVDATALLGSGEAWTASASEAAAAESAASPPQAPAAEPDSPAPPLVDPADGAPDAADEAASSDATPACVSGFGSAETKAGLALLGVTLTGRGALAVGFSRISSGEEIGTRRPAAMFRVGDEWSRVPASSRGNEDGFVAVTSDGDGSAWAVGFTTSKLRTQPLAMRWNGKSWKMDSPRPVRSTATILTDVAIVGSGPLRWVTA